MALAGIPIPETQCIGDSLDTINSAFQTLDAAVAAAAGAGVTKITAGTNISISPTGGTGDVTINAADPGVTQIVAGSNINISPIGGTGAVTINAVAPSSVPTGAVMYFASTSSPTGWIECNGSTIPNSNSTADLYAFLAAAGNPFGGAGKIPDLRGKFIRSNGNDGTYASGTFGATQADLVKAHTHGFSDYFQYGASNSLNVNAQGNEQPLAHNYNIASSTANNTTSQSPVGGTETRPANVALLACIKL